MMCGRMKKLICNIKHTCCVEKSKRGGHNVKEQIKH